MQEKFQVVGLMASSDRGVSIGSSNDIDSCASYQPSIPDSDTTSTTCTTSTTFTTPSSSMTSSGISDQPPRDTKRRRISTPAFPPSPNQPPPLSGLLGSARPEVPRGSPSEGQEQLKQEPIKREMASPAPSLYSHVNTVPLYHAPKTLHPTAGLSVFSITSSNFGSSIRFHFFLRNTELGAILKDLADCNTTTSFFDEALEAWNFQGRDEAVLRGVSVNSEAMKWPMVIHWENEDEFQSMLRTVTEATAEMKKQLDIKVTCIKQDETLEYWQGLQKGREVERQGIEKEDKQDMEDGQETVEEEEEEEEEKVEEEQKMREEHEAEEGQEMEEE